MAMPLTAGWRFSWAGSGGQHGTGCPFCRDFDRIRKDRYARMWHNALVFQEMTAQLNDGPGARVACAAAGR
jgi:hypothetical protein